MMHQNAEDPRETLVSRWLTNPADNDVTRYRREGGRYCIDIRLRSWRQFFDSRDPAPFRDRDLDDDAVAYIVNSFLEINKTEKAKIVLHLDERRGASVPPEVFQDAIRAFFVNESHLARGRRRRMLRRARTALAIGLIFMALCISLAHWISGLPLDMIGTFLSEGLTITGWVALWRPVDILLYEWWPHMDDLEVAKRLARMPVEVIYVD